MKAGKVPLEGGANFCTAKRDREHQTGSQEGQQGVGDGHDP